MQQSRYRPNVQYGISTLCVLAVSFACYVLVPSHAYHVVAYLLLTVVSLLAMLFGIRPVLLAALLSAITWNFFFIPPVFTLHIGNTEDLLLFLMYFIIALVNAVLTSRIRTSEQALRDKEKKEKVIHLYDTVLHSLSHELRTPIATILGAADTLKNTTIPLSPTQQEQLLDAIDTAGIRLNNQVENLLNTSRLESGIIRLKKDWNDIHELVHIALAKVQGGAQYYFLFEPKAEFPLFRVDAGIIDQILLNLFQNVVQHTPAGTVVQIEVCYTDSDLVFDIRDNGPGIPEAERELVFEKFYRPAGTTGSGTGLGLSLVKGFVQAHGGHIRLEGASPQGTRFVVSIPAEFSSFNTMQHEP